MTAFCSLLVCLGPNAATFSALYALVLEPLPLPEASRLVTVVNVAQKSGGQILSSSTPQYVDFRDHADLFAGFSVIRRDLVMLDEENAAARVPKDSVSANFFAVLGVQPIVGRFFSAGEDSAGRDRVVVLSQTFWESHYHGDRAMLGRQISLAGQPYTIVGVAPRAVEVLRPGVCLFQPYAPAASKFDPQSRYRADVALYGRLKPGVPAGAARAQLMALESHFHRNVAGPVIRALIDNSGFEIALEPLRPGGVVGETQALWMMQAGAWLVLLIGGVNVMNLFLARMNTRRSELAIRVALGAGRTRLLRQMLAESFLLTSLAAVTGLGCAMLGLSVFNRYLPLFVPGAPSVALEPAVVGLLFVTAGAIAWAVGFVPLQLFSPDGWRSESRTSSSSSGVRALSGGLVATQVAVAAILLIASALLLRSFANVMAVAPGFDAARVVHGRIGLPTPYNQAPEIIAVQRRILDALQTIPGVERAAMSHDPAIAGNVRPVPFAMRGDAAGGESRPPIHIDTVSPDFFGVMGMRMLAGRAFENADAFAKNPVAIVDETFVARYFPERDVLGEEIYLSKGLPHAVDGWPRIVGVVSRAHLTGLDSRDRLPFVFVPMVEFPARTFNVYVRSSRPPSEVLREMRARLQAIDPAIPFYSTGSLAEELDHLLGTRRGITWLVGVFSGLALLLAVIGLYGMLSYDVSQRTREIGIRGAIGATRGQIVALILRQGMWKVGLGLAFGMIGALFFTRFLGSLLFGIVAADAVSYALVVGVLSSVALLACWFPARRASKVDPIIALRAE